MNVNLYRGGVVATAITGGQTAPDGLLVVDGVIAWIGNTSDLDSLPDAAQDAQVIELNGNLVTPAFHDAHIDVLALGRELLDLPNSLEAGAQTHEVESALHAGLRAAAQAGFAVLNHHDTSGGESQHLELIAQTTAVPESGFPQTFVFGAGSIPNESVGAKVLDQTPSISGFGPCVLDGSFFEHAAALEQRYADKTAPQWSGDDPGLGDLHLTQDEVTAHLIAATRLGRPTVLHAHGDRALHTLVAAFEAAASEVGADELRAVGHQVVGAEMIDATALTSLVLFGVMIVVDVQSEIEFGGEDGIYAHRLGPVRSVAMNPWADLVTTGVEIRLATFAPERGFNPWATVHGAMTHHDRGQRLSMIDAFGAHTGGNISLEVGSEATFAIWSGTEVDLYPLRTRRGYGQLETVLPLPALSSLESQDLSVEPLRCVETVRAGISLTS